MTFTPNIPASGQSLGQTRDLIRDNFRNYSTALSLNHGAPNDIDQGKHKFLQMPEQGSAPFTDVNEMGLYTKEVSGTSRLFLKQENNGSEIQMSGVTPSNVGNDGYTFLPGGFLLQWGRVTISSASASWPVTYPTPFSLPAYSIQVVPSQNRTAYVATNTVNNGMTINLSASMNVGETIYWMAIGSKA